jgi:alpha-L-fucosidase
MAAAPRLISALVQIIMVITRRHALGLLAAALPAAQMETPPPPGIEPLSGPFKGTRESLREYEIPEWFRDAKFGIWAHWGPQSAVEAGDWYARNMYM